MPYFGWGFLPGFCAHPLGLRLRRLPVTELPGAKQKVYQANLALGPIEAAGLTAKTQAKVALQAGDDDAGTVSAT